MRLSGENHSPSRAEIDRLIQLFGKRDYHGVVRVGQSLLQHFPHARPEQVMRIDSAVGAAQVVLGNYRDALHSLLPAHDFARARRDYRALVNTSNSIAWIYLKMDNLASAAEFADQAMAGQRALGTDDVRVISLRALISTRERDFTRGDALFAEAINHSLDAGDLAFAANAWYFQGRGYAAAHRYPEAAVALTESFRLRKLHHLPDLDVSLRDLAEVVAAQGDLRTSTALLDEAARAMADPNSGADLWGFLLDRGRLRMMKGDLRGALPDLRASLELARRLDVIPTDDDRITFESGLAELYALFIECGNRLYLETRDSGLKAEIFEAAEENRAASLRALVPQPNGWRAHLPPEHAGALAQLQTAERDLFTNPGPANERHVRELRVSLDQIESRAECAEEPGQLSALEAATNALDADTAILSFHLGPETSWLWVITQQAFEVYPLPERAELGVRAKLFRSAVRGGSASTNAGDALGAILLGKLPLNVHRKSKWILALDQELFQLPLGALRWKGRYLVEDHALLLTPGIRLLKAAGTGKSYDGKLIAIGDPIYNQADERWKASPEVPRWNPFSHRPKDTWQLARLTGSGEEARSAVKSWGNGVAFTGESATKTNLLRILKQRPTILHLATHVIPALGNTRAGMIVLGLDSGGEPQFFDMRDIVKQALQAELVVMSGCASGDAEALPASGLMGLTRAWLGSGVDDVLATLWPSLDDDGVFFASFYSNLRQHPASGAATALQRAKLEMIRSRGFRANPEYWGSYFLIGKV